MTVATINGFIRIFADALGALNYKVPMPEIERLAMLVHSSMENKRRAYHTSTHVFDMCEGMNPRQVLAALFHDVVYFQLDGGFPYQAAPLLEPVAQGENGALILREIDKEDTALQLCADIFGFIPGQTLPLFCGMNEFLSAVVAVRLLRPYLQMRDLVAIVACIEATVPFRGDDSTGRACSSILADRVLDQSKKLLGLLTDKELEQYLGTVMREVVILANRDVGGFAEPSPGKFLAATWLLIEESNAPLAAVGIYTIQEYRGALLRMENFLGGLKAEVIFHRYANYPDRAEYDRLVEAARGNLHFSHNFLGAKLTSIAIIEALALLTGGNCPVSMFLGDIRNAQGKPDRVEDFLPPTDTSTDIDPSLLQVLEKGRAQESSNDLTASPLTAFVYCCLGHKDTFNALRQSKQMFAGELSARDFLKGLNRKMINAIIDACAHIAISRRDDLLTLKVPGSN